MCGPGLPPGPGQGGADCGWGRHSGHNGATRRRVTGPASRADQRHGRWCDQRHGHRHGAADGRPGHHCAGAGRRRCAPGARRDRGHHQQRSRQSHRPAPVTAIDRGEAMQRPGPPQQKTSSWTTEQTNGASCLATSLPQAMGSRPLAQPLLISTGALATGQIACAAVDLAREKPDVDAAH